MKRPLIAGNWKMNLNRQGAVGLAKALAARSSEFPGADVLVCPPSVYLTDVAAALAGSPIKVGGQNMYHESSGAFTGEISPPMLRDVGCTHVILGHSERRHILGETNAAVCRKTHAALAAGLTPIVCVGELLEQREAGQTGDIIREQMAGSLAGLTAAQVALIVLAYEPVWAIGTGKVATPEQAAEVHADLRKVLTARYNAESAAQVRILYGGSVKADNAAELLSQPHIDGVLVGGASLKEPEFVAIAAARK